MLDVVACNILHQCIPEIKCLSPCIIYVTEIPMGETPLDLIGVNDIGQVARTVFLNKANFLEKTLSLCGDKQTIQDIALKFTKTLSPMVFKDKPVSTNI